jgi:hypothetical protein
MEMYLRVIDKKTRDKRDWSVTIPNSGFGNITILNLQVVLAKNK